VVEEVPHAMVAFQGRLLASVGKLLRIYELGKKKLLRKCECNAIPNLVTKLHTQGNRIIAADVAESLFFLTYNHEQNRLIVFADDFLPRYIVSTCMLDYDTFACGDKFGNFFVLRLPKEVSEDLDDDPTGNKALHARPFLQAAAYKVLYFVLLQVANLVQLESLCEFHVGDIVTSIHKTSMTLGGREVIFLTTLGGSLRVMIPFTSKDDVETFSTLEMHLRQERLAPTGRSHASWRGSFVPVKAVVDGDLCELFAELSMQKRLDVAEAMERAPADVGKKLEDMRTRNAF
jgi:splicing factor 3B subunit 3